jgi:hypothetical protein
LAFGWRPSPSITGLGDQSYGDDMEELEVFYEGIVKTIYEANPSALERHHLNGDVYSDDSCGYTPLHFLCLEQIPQISLINHFALKSPSSFAVIASRVHICRYAKLFTGQSQSTVSNWSCLHLIVKHDICDEDVVQTIFKAAPTMVMAKGYGYHTPISALCGRYDVANCYGDDDVFFSMFYSLLEANFSDEVNESPPVAMLLKNSAFIFRLLKRCFKSTDPNLVHYDGAPNALDIFYLLQDINLEEFETPTQLYRSSFQKELVMSSKSRVSPEQNFLQVAASLLKGIINLIR